MKVLIIGGAGFIGINLINNFLKKKKYKIFVIDNLTYASNKKEISRLSKIKKINFFKVSIVDLIKIKKIIKFVKPDKIINFAAETHVDNSILDPYPFIKTNIVGTYAILESIKDYYLNQKYSSKKIFKYIHISTDEVYGDVKNKSNEMTRYNPSSPYSASKASSDFLVKSWGRTYGIPYIITNCSNNFGPYQHNEKLIPKVINNFINGKSIPVYGKGNQKRDWIYVEDHILALEKIIKSNIINETFNISSGKTITNLQIINTIKKIFEKKLKFTFKKNLIQFVKDRPGHDNSYIVDSSKIKNKLKWKPKTSLEKGLLKTINWYLNR